YFFNNQKLFSSYLGLVKDYNVKTQYFPTHIYIYIYIYIYIFKSNLFLRCNILNLSSCIF
ncbi:hypothetical protein K6L59_03765, partial [Candidatus Phytoplasma sp. Tabriz.2]|nr:hypothetical protein [Candidatus Phytoplasma australiense]